MTIHLAAPLALLALLCTAPAYASAADGAHSGHTETQAPATNAKKGKERKICRSETATGSVMPKRVCRTVAQIEEDERNAERFRDQQNRPGGAIR